jgi:hypothetical protein
VTTSPPVPAGSSIGKRGELAQAVAAAVDAVAGVRRSAGSRIEAATQYRGGKVVGVALGDDVVTVHIVAEQLPLLPLVARVQAAVSLAVAAEAVSRVDVMIEDLDVSSLPGSIQ